MITPVKEKVKGLIKSLFNKKEKRELQLKTTTKETL